MEDKAMITSEYELDRFCERNPNCGCNCMQCPAMAQFQRHELGYDEWDEDEEEV